MTNMVQKIKTEKTWVIYKHTLVADCEKYGWSYIGQTCQKRPCWRWGRGSGYTSNKSGKHCFFANAINTYGWDNFTHEILETGILSQEEANTRERFWISHFHTFVGDPDCRGFNLTEGGGGNSGYKLSAEAIERIRLSHLGKHCSPETEIPARPVYCITTGVSYLSIQEAARQTGSKAESIQRCCISDLLSTNSLQWCYLEDKENFKVRKADDFKRSLVYCVELDRLFNSYYEAEKTLCIDRHKISHCCKGRVSHAGGYTWKLVDGIIVKPWNKGKKGTYCVNKQPTVFQYDLFGNFIASYVSQTQAARCTGVSQGNIGACLRGLRKQAGGFIWKKQDLL